MTRKNHTSTYKKLETIHGREVWVKHLSPVLHKLRWRSKDEAFSWLNKRYKLVSTGNGYSIQRPGIKALGVIDYLKGSVAISIKH
jgi:hypothetical protein